MFLLRSIVLVPLLIVSTLGYSTINQADSRINFLTKLLNTSSGAKQVLKSSNPKVKELHQKAKELYEQARIEYGNGNEKEATALLDQSAKTMFSPIRLATPKTSGKSKEKRDYNNHKKSVQALNRAYNRVADEKNYRGKKQINDKVKSFVEVGDALSDASKYVQAKAELDKAYQLLKISIESICGGLTLASDMEVVPAGVIRRYATHWHEGIGAHRWYRPRTASGPDCVKT